MSQRTDRPRMVVTVGLRSGGYATVRRTDTGAIVTRIIKGIRTTTVLSEREYLALTGRK